MMVGYYVAYKILVEEDSKGQILNEEDVRENVERIINLHKPESREKVLKEDK